MRNRVVTLCKSEQFRVTTAGTIRHARSDDNIRALMLMARIEDHGGDEAAVVRALTSRHLAFVSHAFERDDMIAVGVRALEWLASIVGAGL